MENNNYILTGASALFYWRLISFNPSYTTIEMEYGTKTDNYSSKYKISTQSKDTINIGIKIESSGQRVYSPERLYIELNKFALENTIKTQAIKNLENIINPEIVKKYYDKLKNKRRNLNKEQIEQFLEKHLMNVKEVFQSNKFDPNQIIREYLMALLSRKNSPLCLIKGGSAIELFIKNKRATQDLDIHNDKEDIAQIIEYLQDKQKIIFFKFEDINEFLSNIWNNQDKKIWKIIAYPRTNLKIAAFELLKPIELTFNTSYDHKQLKQFMVNFNIQKRNLKIFKNALALVFSREMLIAEKYQSLISKPEESTRTKDLIDLASLFNDSINQYDIYNWLLIKWLNLRKPQDPNHIKDIILQNQDKPLIKIKENFNDAIKMYDIDLFYSDCIKIYKKISAFILKEMGII